MSTRTGRLELALVKPDPGAIRSELLARHNKGSGRVVMFPDGRLAEDVIRKCRSDGIDISLCASFEDVLADLKRLVDAGSREDPCIVLLHENPSDLSGALLRLLDLPGGSVIAPITSHYWKRKPLFMISIPKSGTHLMYELVSAFGYRQGGNSSDDPAGGTAYFINSMNPHTPTTFLDFKESSSNLYHPFMRCPALFSYRNPLDIVVSEANYYHKDGRSAFWSYLSGLDLDGRVRLLINDPFMLGTIRDRVMPFLGWLGLKNVIPLSYEELVGARGGGSEELQTRLIWSLQLKLHVPGNPREYASRIYNDASPTFNSGQLGTHQRALSKEALRSFLSLPQDFMSQLGYLDENGGSRSGAVAAAMPQSPQARDGRGTLLFSKRIDEFRNRPLVLSTAAVDEKPILMLANYCGHNIVRLRGRYYAIGFGDGPVQLDSLGGGELSGFMSDVDLASLKQQIMLKPKMLPLRILRRLMREVRRRLRGGR